MVQPAVASELWAQGVRTPQVQELYPHPPSQRCGSCQNFKQTTLTTRLYKVRTNLCPHLRKRSDAPVNVYTVRRSSTCTRTSTSSTVVSTIAQSSAAVVAVELVVHVGGQPSSDRPTDRGAGILVGGQQSIAARRQTALVAHLGERRQTSFSTTRHSWRRDSVSIRRLHAEALDRSHVRPRHHLLSITAASLLSLLLVSG